MELPPKEKFAFLMISTPIRKALGETSADKVKSESDAMTSMIFETRSWCKGDKVQ